jgi:microcompartment protein CcmL/EutN
MSKVEKSVALQFVTDWMDKKRLRPSKRENLRGTIDELAACVEDGVLEFEESGEIVHHLIFPITDEHGNETVKQLRYKLRVNERMLEPYRKGLKAGDNDGRLNAYVCALTGSVKGVIHSLDSEDLGIAQNIALFFL